MNQVLIVYISLAILCVLSIPIEKNKFIEVREEYAVYLTPFINNGSIAEGREAAKVQSEVFPPDVLSYSAFFTVNHTLSKNLFSWFFPSVNPKDPVVLWLQGGPGMTSLYGLFAEIGPFQIEDGLVVMRNTSWTNSHSVLFVDNPVGTGFSYTANDQGLAHDEYQIGNELYEFLTQFFLIFPEYRSNDFFVTGESYAGKYIPVISHVIDVSNENLPDSSKINLKGLAIGNGWLDPVNQMNVGEYAYQHGFVDKNTRNSMNKLRDEATELLKQNKLIESTLVQREITKIFRNATGFASIYNYLHPEKQDTSDQIANFVQKYEVRKAIHVGNASFNSDDSVDNALLGDIMISVANLLIDLLGKYRVLIFSGQLDIAVPYPTTVNYLEKLKFSSAEEYERAKRHIWYREKSIAGYIKVAGNLTEMVILNSGHMVPTDQPEVAYDMMYAFTRNKTLV